MVAPSGRLNSSITFVSFVSRAGASFVGFMAATAARPACIGSESLLSSRGLPLPWALVLIAALTIVFGLDLPVLLGFLDRLSSAYPDH
jgi:hypothetical protein